MPNFFLIFNETSYFTKYLKGNKQNKISLNVNQNNESVSDRKYVK